MQFISESFTYKFACNKKMFNCKYVLVMCFSLGMLYNLEDTVSLLFQQVSHGATQFTVYEELRKIVIDLKSRKKKSSESSEIVLVTL